MNALLQKLKDCDEAAFKELVNSYEKKVLNICYRFFLNKEDAEDIAQEVFIEVYQSIHSFKGDAKLSTWIYRIAVTKCLDELKKRKRKKRITSIGKILHIDEFVKLLAGGSMPDSSIHENDRMSEVLQALNKLPDNQRVAFTLSKIEGYNNTEIAEIMYTTTIAVESLVSRAKKKVSDELEIILKKQ